MANYTDLEKDFIERTMCLVNQYHETMSQYHFEEQYNYTLIINCLLGLIVVPKEKVVTYVPKDKLTDEFKRQIGLNKSFIDPAITTLRDLVFSLRHTVAHFNISVISDSEKKLIDWIEFVDTEKDNRTVAKFRSTEILPFLQYYTRCLLSNIEKYKNKPKR